MRAGPVLTLTYVGTLGLLFRVYGGPFNALGRFLRHSQVIASGYSSQMSYQGSMLELAIISAAMGLAIIATVAGILLKAGYTSALSITLFPLFVLFKGAIVRHDFAHIIMSVPPIVGLAAFLLPGRISRLQSWTAQAVVTLAIVGGFWFSPPSASSLLTRGAINWVNFCQCEETRASFRAFDSKAKWCIRQDP